MKKKKAEDKEKPRRKLPDKAYQIGCWVCWGQHRPYSCDADKSNMLCELCGKEKNHVTAVCLQQFADSSPARQPGGRPATPGIQSGMVPVETKKPSYAQVAAAIVVSFTSGPSFPPPPPLKLPLPLPGGSELSYAQGHCPGGRLGKSMSTREGSASGGKGRSVDTHDVSAEKAFTAARLASGQPKVLVELASGGGAAVVVALADTGATTSLINRGVAESIKLNVRNFNIELTGLNGRASTVG